jgi:NADH-quinone oxidoreductase subunit C/D
MSSTETAALAPAAARVSSRLATRFPAVAVRDLDLPTVETVPADWPKLARFLRDDFEMRFDLLLDLCGVDNLRRAGRPGRFEAVAHLYSTSRDEHLRVKVLLDSEAPSLPTAVDVWPAANWFEREAFDLYGIQFQGHPNLKRLLCHLGFVGHALRKDYAPGQRWMCTDEDLYVPDLVHRENEEADHFETVVVNLGPSHPATHGTLRVVARLDGEQILEAESEIGYLHRCFEKMSETHTWTQVIPYTDRLNYCSPFINNVAYCKTIERMLGIELPERGQLIRTILSEFSRIMDHCVCIGANLVDTGALTNFWYLFQCREEIYSLIEACCGARLTVSYGRIGGLSRDVPADFVDRCKSLLEKIPPFIDDVDRLLTKNKIFWNRFHGTGVVTKEQAIAWGFTGPSLRASGVGYDVRRARPYDYYGDLDFEVPIHRDGDNYARFLVRMEEMRQSLSIVRQALARLKAGPVNAPDWHVSLPPKNNVYHDMESLIYHFKLIMEGIQVPEGERYEWFEGANGELGFYVVSVGGGSPYRIKVRPPCFPLMAAFEKIIVGAKLSDAIVTLGSLNIIAGELDR